MTGRGIGFCAGFNQPGNANFAPGMGLGRGFRGGRGGGRCGAERRGFGLGFRAFARFPEAAAVGAVDEKSALQNRLDVLKRQLSAVESRLEELK